MKNRHSFQDIRDHAHHPPFPSLKLAGMLDLDPIRVVALPATVCLDDNLESRINQGTDFVQE